MRYIHNILLLLFCVAGISTAEDTHPQPGAISGHISPDDVQVTILVKRAGTSYEKGDNLKGMLTLSHGGAFTFSDIPPGEYDMLFRLRGESRYKYFVNPVWSKLVVKPGETTAGIDYRLTPKVPISLMGERPVRLKGPTALIDEIYVEFPIDFPEKNIAYVLDLFKCSPMREPYVLKTAKYRINIPDDTTAEQMVAALQKHPAVVRASIIESGRLFIQPLESHIAFTVREGYEDLLPQEPQIELRLSTEKSYTRSNYGIHHRVDIIENTITVTILHITVPGISKTFPWYATARSWLTIPPGRYVLKFVHEEQADTYTLSVTESSLRITEQTAMFTKPTVTQVNRYPRNSFSVLCGPNAGDAQDCHDFLALLASEIDLHPFQFTLAGSVPYECMDRDNYIARCFLYTTPHDLDHVVELLYSFPGREKIRLQDWMNRYSRR